MSQPTPGVESAIIKDEATTKSWSLLHELHERLIITLVIISSLLFVGNKFLNHEADKDKAAATVAQQTLQLQADQNKTLAAQVAQTQQQYTLLVTQISQQNSQLAQATTQRTVVLQQQQATDQSVPIPDLGNRWAQLEKLDPSSLTANTQGIEVTPEAARTTVEQLEEIPVLQANIGAEQATAANLQKVIDSATVLNTQLTDQVKGLSEQNVDQTKACSTEITAVKAEARKSKLHWFVGGFVTGYVAGIVTKTIVHL